MNIVVLTGRYPSKDSPYSHMFVHTRNMEYVAKGHQVTVLVPAKSHAEYEIDGVKVVLSNVNDLVRYLDSADRVMIHLLMHRLDKTMDAEYLYQAVLTERIPTLFFIHGVESQTIWNSRREDIKWHNPKTIARWLYRDCYLIKRMRKTLTEFNQSGVPCKFVTPSKWMLDESIRHTGIDLSHKSLVIPNGIDTKHFKFTDHWDNRHKLLSIRPLIYKGKYAVDLLLESASALNDDYTLTLYGRGQDETIIADVAQKKINQLNFNLKPEFINQKDIPNIHSDHGIYLAVTRMDAQGVSMCEAMASGMPTISFDTCAISEFIKHGETGLLAKAYDVTEYTNYINELAESRTKFDAIASNARRAMEAIDVRITTEQELNERI